MELLFLRKPLRWQHNPTPTPLSSRQLDNWESLLEQQAELFRGVQELSLQHSVSWCWHHTYHAQWTQANSKKQHKSFIWMFSRQRSKSNKEQRSLFFQCLPRRLPCTVQCNVLRPRCLSPAALQDSQATFQAVEGMVEPLNSTATFLNKYVRLCQCLCLCLCLCTLGHRRHSVSLIWTERQTQGLSSTAGETGGSKPEAQSKRWNFKFLVQTSRL